MQWPLSIRLCVVLLVICLLWALVGAPLHAPEWRALPDTMLRLIRQWPVKTQPMLRQWLLRSMAEDTISNPSGYMLSVWDCEQQQCITLPLESYVLGVVAAEMPAEYHLEALKCQAVAARTRALFTMRSLGGKGCASHPGQDVCTSSACCQGYMDRQARVERWQEQADRYERKLRQAVESTSGMLVTWQGMPAEMLYHASSGGQTEDAAQVFAHSVPYLVSVSSPGEEDYAGYEADTAMTCAEAAKQLNAYDPSCDLTADDIPGLIRLQSTTTSGRIREVLVGTVLLTGSQFRQALGLRSAICTWDADQGMITFHTRGYGHGVGMSQVGAQSMAMDGQQYASILAHYYPGTDLVSLPLP